MSDVVKRLQEISRAERAADRAAARAAAKAAPKPAKTTQTRQPKTPQVQPIPSAGGVGGTGAGAGQQSSGFASSHDCGPWIESTSSRVSEYRYDYANGQLQVRWTNTRGKHRDQTIYQCGDPDTGAGGTHVYRAFAQAVSKGKYVNNVFNENISYWPGDDASFNVPSNPNRGDVSHKP